MDFQNQIDKLILAYSISEEGIVKFRHSKLEAINTYFKVNGYPTECSLPLFSLYPAYFQEAIYDGIAWYDQEASLHHLTIDLELDCMFQNRGKLRIELSSIEFKTYINFCSMAIDNPRHKPKRNYLLILKNKLFGK